MKADRVKEPAASDEEMGKLEAAIPYIIDDEGNKHYFDQSKPSAKASDEEIAMNNMLCAYAAHYRNSRIPPPESKGLDLDAAIGVLSDLGQEICEDHCDHYDNGRGESVHCSMCNQASELRKILRRLRAQAEGGAAEVSA